MNQFIQFVNQLSLLDEEINGHFLTKLTTRTVSKGDYILKKGEVCRYLYMIDQGLVKTYFNKGEKEFIMQFFAENSMITVLDSFLTEKPSSYSMLALEHTTVTYITKTELDKLCKSYHSVETFFRKLVSLASVNMMKRISEMLEENGTERYNSFLQVSNQLMQRISLGDLANYLGITQVSLSRIRARK